MSARALLAGAAVAALREVGLRAFDAPPVRGALPHAVVGEPVLKDWSAAALFGREGTLMVSLHDAGERPERLRAALELAELAVETLEPVLGQGWRLVRMSLVRSRIVRAGERWLGTSEFVVRMYRENG